MEQKIEDNRSKSWNSLHFVSEVIFILLFASLNLNRNGLVFRNHPSAHCSFFIEWMNEWILHISLSFLFSISVHINWFRVLFSTKTEPHFADDKLINKNNDINKIMMILNTRYTGNDLSSFFFPIPNDCQVWCVLSFFELSFDWNLVFIFFSLRLGAFSEIVELMLGYVSNANDMRTLHALQVFSSSSSSCLVRCFRNNRTEFISFSQITDLQKRKTVASDRVHKYLPFLVNCARARSLAVRSSNYKMKSCLIWFICLFIEFVPYRSERWSTNNRQEIKIKKSEFDKTFLLQWNQRHSRCLNERGLTHIHNSTIIFMEHFGVWITITQLRIESNWKEWKARENKRIQRLRERKRERELNERYVSNECWLH